MSFARHQTFYLRSGWLSKAFELIPTDPSLFRSKDSTVKLGIGKNMVHALRFWTRAAGLVEHERNGLLEFSHFGLLVKQGDPFFEHDLTWWMIHFHIVANEQEASSWHYVFNELSSQDFDSILFIQGLENKLRGRSEVSRSSLLKDFDCIRATYVAPKKEQGTPEDNIICPLTRFGLLEELQNGSLRKVQSTYDIPLSVVYHVCREVSKGQTRLNIDQLTAGACSPAFVFNLTVDSVYRYLDQMKERGWLDFSVTAGLDSVNLLVENPWDLIGEDYKTLQGANTHDSW